MRFALGLVEAAVLPAMVIFLSHWFTQGERGRANTILILGNPITVLWLTAISGFVIEAISWRGMFIVEGLPPSRGRSCSARWSPTTRARRSGCRRPSATRSSRRWPRSRRRCRRRRGYRDALRSHNVVLLSVQYFLWSVGVYGFIFWLPTIVKAGSGAGIGDTGLISAAPYALAAVLMYLNSRASDRSGRRVVFVWPWLAIGAVAFYGSYLLGPDRFWASYVLLFIAGGVMYAPYGPFFAAISEFLARDVAAPAIALINSFGALGAFAGSYFVGWLDDLTGDSSASFLLLAGSLAAAAVLMLFVRAPRLRERGPSERFKRSTSEAVTTRAG